jgi:hypothetical protein
MPERTALKSRLYLYMRTLIGHGWNVTTTVLLSLYSLWTLFAPDEIQRKTLAAIYIDPHQKIAVWLATLAAFLFYTGFRAWDEEHAIAERTSESATAKEVARLRSELGEIHSYQWQRLTDEQKANLA